MERKFSRKELYEAANALLKNKSHPLVKAIETAERVERLVDDLLMEVGACAFCPDDEAPGFCSKCGGDYSDH